ncbi:MAG: hypothetical protein QNJ92_16640 [Alphaproteobacteria bacterium]|nr:hypothetical protein [Alphaproteobacteria bacterium]
MNVHKLIRTTALTLLLATLPAAAFGDEANLRTAGPQGGTKAVDAFLKLDGLKGESRDNQSHMPAAPDQLHVDQVLTGVMPKAPGHDQDLGTPTTSTADDKHNTWIEVLSTSSDSASPDDTNPGGNGPGGSGPDGGDHDPGVTLVEMLPAAADTQPTKRDRHGEFWFEDLHPGHHSTDGDPTATRKTRQTQPGVTREGLSRESLRRVKTPLTETQRRTTRTPVLKKSMAPRPMKALRRTAPTVQPAPATPQAPRLRRQRRN